MVKLYLPRRKQLHTLFANMALQEDYDPINGLRSAHLLKSYLD